MMSIVQSRMPIIKWLPEYNIRHFLVGDIVAGLTVGLMVIPQGLAFAAIARLPLQYGLYAAFMGSLLYAPFGTSRQLTIGPTTILSLIVATESVTSSGGSHLNRAIFIAFFSGALQVIAGLCHLELLLNFISPHVISGFTSASALIIAVTQVRRLTGIPVRSAFSDAIYDIFANVASISLGDTLLGVFCIIALTLMSYLKKYKRNEYPLLWFLCISRNAIVVFTTTLMTFIIFRSDSPSYAVVGEVPSGLPPFSLSFLTTLESAIVIDVAPIVLTCTVIGLIDAIAVAKAFARETGTANTLRPQQELVALGIIQVVGSFFGAYPVTGSFSRTAVNAEAGASTPLNGIFATAVITMALLFGTSAMAFIPQSALAAVIITAVLYMFDWQLFLALYKLGQFGSAAWWDLAILVVSFWCCLFIGLELGIAIGVITSVTILLYRTSSPKVCILRPHRQHDVITWRELRKEDDIAGGHSNADYTALLSDVCNHVLVLRIKGNFMFYTINHIIAAINAAERHHSHDYLEEQVLSEGNNVDGQAEVHDPKIISSSGNDLDSNALSDGKSVDKNYTDIASFSQIQGLVIDMSAVNDIDTSGLKALEVFVRSFNERQRAVGVHFVETQWNIQDLLIKTFTSSKTIITPIQQRFHYTIDDAMIIIQRELRTVRTPQRFNRSRIFRSISNDNNNRNKHTTMVNNNNTDVEITNTK